MHSSSLSISITHKKERKARMGGFDLSEKRVRCRRFHALLRARLRLCFFIDFRHCGNMKGITNEKGYAIHAQARFSSAAAETVTDPGLSASVKSTHPRSRAVL
jgi:hypothetical protein